MFTQTTSGGAIADKRCVPQVPTPPTSPCISYQDMQSAYCQAQANTCSATGGTFGNVNGGNVCIPAGTPGTPAPCASGATQFVTNADGSSSASCVGGPNITGDPTDKPIKVDPTTSTPQGSADATANNTAAIANINTAGFQAIVNAINNNTSHAGGGGSGSSAAQDQANADGIKQAINDLKDQEKGAGQCDPKAANYAQCIGEVSQAEDPSSAQQTAINAGNDALNSVADQVTQSISGRETVEDGTAGIVDTIKSYLPNSGGCTGVTWNFPHTDIVVTCEKTDLLRAWLAWGLAISTLLGCFYVAFGRSA
jgi:hypothetical protein